MTKNKYTFNEKCLMRRYLIWCYKTTKEDIDRIDRYFTQNIVDAFLLEGLTTGKKSKQELAEAGYKKLVDEFSLYAVKKKENAQQKKFSDNRNKELSVEYLYLKNRLSLIEKAILHFYDEKELKSIIRLYEEEMTRRILQAREHS